MPLDQLIAFSVSDTGSGARERVRQILRFQLAYEMTERIREGLIGLLAVCSGLLWLAAAWPALLSQAVVRATLVAWIMVVAAAVVALVVERHWRRLQQRLAQESLARRKNDLP
jgi:hypothetical protein